MRSEPATKWPAKVSVSLNSLLQNIKETFRITSISDLSIKDQEVIAHRWKHLEGDFLKSCVRTGIQFVFVVQQYSYIHVNMSMVSKRNFQADTHDMHLNRRLNCAFSCCFPWSQWLTLLVLPWSSVSCWQVHCSAGLEPGACRAPVWGRGGGPSRSLLQYVCSQSHLVVCHFCFPQKRTA